MTQFVERPPISMVSAWWGLSHCFPGLYSLTGSATLAWEPSAWAAVLETDLEQLENGLETVVGPKG